MGDYKSFFFILTPYILHTNNVLLICTPYRIKITDNYRLTFNMRKLINT